MSRTRLAAFLLAPVLGAIALAAPLVGAQTSSAGQTADGWTSGMTWSDGKQVQWRAAAAPGCDGSNVDLRLVNNSASAGSGNVGAAAFSCRRGAEFTSPPRQFGVVMAGSQATTATLNCMCAEQGGVRDLLSVDLDFRREGVGTDVLANGCTYQGGYVAGQRSGRGVYACPTGYRYDGFFQAGQVHGSGKETLPDGQVYDGDFVQGVRQGRGRMVYIDGSIYDGEFRAGLRDGAGTMIYRDKAEYVGDWKADRREGQGVYSGAGGAWSYTGGWSNDLRNGQGKLTYADGSYIYEGLFRNDLREGEGVATFNDGRSFRGVFVGGEQLGMGELSYPDGRRIVGQFRDHRPNGKAIESGPQAIFDGVWVNGALQGPATVTYPNGVRFEGQFVNGRRNGLGVESQLDGSKSECQWVDDVRQQPCTKIAANGARIEYRGNRRN